MIFDFAIFFPELQGEFEPLAARMTKYSSGGAEVVAARQESRVLSKRIDSVRIYKNDFEG